MVRGDTPLATGAAARLELRADADDGALLLRLAEPLEVSAETIAADALAPFGLPPEAVALLSGARRLTVSPWTGGGEIVELSPGDDGWRWTGQATAQLALAEGGIRLQSSAGGTLGPDFAVQRLQAERLELTAQGLSYGPHRAERASFTGTAEAKPDGLSIDGTLQADGLRVAAGPQALSGVSLRAPLALRHTPAGTRVTLSEPGRIVVPELPPTPPVTIDTPVRLDLQALEATAVGGQLQASARLDPGRLSGTVRREGDDPAPISAETGPVDLALDLTGTPNVRASFSGGRIVVHWVPAQASDVALTLDTGGDGPLATLTAGRVEHLGRPSFAAPARIEAKLTRSPEGLLRADGRIAVIGAPFEVELLAVHSPSAGSGSVSLNRTVVDFEPGRLQPGDLSPLLAEQVERAQGTVELSGHIGWSSDGLESSGTLELVDLDLTTPYATLEGLQGPIGFDRLVRPRTDGLQTIWAERAVAGLPLTEVTVRFELDWPIAGPQIRLDLAEGRIAGGRVFVAAEHLAPLAERNQMTVRVEALSLAQLVQELEVEGVTAEGTLEGQVPVALGPEGLSIDQGRLDAVETGSIKVQLGQTSDALASQGEQVALMVRALKDFQYDELSLTLRRPADGSPELGITMQGNNPDVLDGYPFRFNITLTGDLEPILTALQEGRRLTSELLDRALEAQQVQ